MDIWSNYWKVSRAISQGASQLGHAGAANATIRRAGRGPRRGLLAPGDPPPVASAAGGHYDYRGVLDARRLPEDVSRAPFGLGRFISPSRGLLGPIGLPDRVVSQHITLVGPTGAGKTTGIVVPWMAAALRAGWSVVTIDIKGDLLDRVGLELGQPLGNGSGRFDYTRPQHSLHWNWLAEIDSERAIDNTVQSILGRKAPPGTDPYFFNSDSQILRGMLELVAVSHKQGSMTATTVLNLLKDQDRLTRLLTRTVSNQAVTRLRDLTNLDPADYPKRVSGVVAKLDTLARPTLERVMSRCDFRAQDILSSPRLLSIVAPLQDGQMAEMFSSLLVNQLLYRAYERFGSNSGIPVLLVLDEAPRLADRVDLEQILSVARAAGVAVLLALQDAAQFTDENQRSVIFANSGTVICTEGVSSATAKLMSDRLGVHPVASTAMSQGPYVRGQGNGPSLSTSVTMSAVLAEREIMSPPFGGRPACVHARDLSTKPFFVDLTRP